MEEDDEALARAAQKSPAAFGRLYQRYAERVYHYVYSRVGSAREAEDLTAQAFTDALAALPRYRTQGNFAGWLFTFAYRRCADFHRRPGADSLSEQAHAGSMPDPARQAEQGEIFSRLEKILEGLSAEERELLRLHYAARLSYRDMAGILGRNEGAVKMAMSRLVQKMKARWEVEHE